MSTHRTIKVFIASPGDLAVERRAFKEVVDELNNGFGRGAKVTFEPLGWEDALATVGRRSQSVINQDIDSCDVFVLVMWRRWGQEAPDAAPYTSYTEEEFYRALARFEKDGKPTIFVLFKHIDPGQMADPGPELAKVLAFRKKLEQTRKVLYRGFGDEKSFRLEIDKHLAAFADGKCETIDADRALPIIPDSIKAELDKAVEELEKLRTEAKRAQEEAEQARAQANDATSRAEAAERVAETKAATRAVTLAEEAAKAALDGRIEDARQGFSKALDSTNNLRVLYLGFQFFERIGELDEAERLIRRWLAISGPDSQNPNTAAAYANLCIVLQTRGDLDGAEAMCRKALAIEEKLNNFEGMARDYGNLGIILQLCGDSAGAEAMLRKALRIYEELGQEEGVAGSYGNLGTIFRDRGDLDSAEVMLRKALEINERLVRWEGLANVYGNLGNVFRMRGDLSEAEIMYRKVLEIDEKLGRRESIAIAYGSLGHILHARGNVNEAQEMWIKSRDLFAKLGAQHMVNKIEGWIDGLSE